MSDPFAPKNGRVDVASVMAVVRERIVRRREEALAAGAPVEAVVARKLAALADDLELEPDLLAHLLSGDARWNVSPDYRIVTHRKGLTAFVVVTLKKLARPFVRLYTDPVVERQAQINLYLLHVLEALVDENTRLEEALAALRRRVEAGSERPIPKP
jgi:hypothetical protein